LVAASSPRLTYYLADGQEACSVVIVIVIGLWSVLKRLSNVWVALRAILEAIEACAA
jgi:hypothetical protein